MANHKVSCLQRRTNHSFAMATKLLHLCLLSGVLAGVLAAWGSTTVTTMPCPATSYRCGDAVDIRYPFWVEDSTGGANNAPHCGYPSLRLECRGGTPVLPLPSGYYAVTRILYGDGDGDHSAAERTVTVYDLRVSRNQSCPLVAGRSLVLPPGSPPPLALTARDRNLTFLLDCTLVGAAEIVPCLKNGEYSSYVFRDGVVSGAAARLCKQTVVMPVLSPVDGDVVTALSAGFELSWRPAVGGDCGSCEKARGFCGADEPFSCFTAPAASKHSRSIAQTVLIICTLVIVSAGLLVLLCKCIRKRRLAQEGSRGIQMGSNSRAPAP